MSGKVLILTDGKAGHENQSKAFARALGFDFDVVEVHFKSKLAKAKSYLLDNLGIVSLGLLDGLDNLENQQYRAAYMSAEAIRNQKRGRAFLSRVKSTFTGKPLTCSISSRRHISLKSSSLSMGSVPSSRLSLAVAIRESMVMIPFTVQVKITSCPASSSE